MPEDEESDNWEGYESGPFCRHWSDPGDCERLCACGHACGYHLDWDYDAVCNLDGCHCENFIDKAEPVGVWIDGSVRRGGR